MSTVPYPPLAGAIWDRLDSYWHYAGPTIEIRPEELRVGDWWCTVNPRDRTEWVASQVTRIFDMTELDGSLISVEKYTFLLDEMQERVDIIGLFTTAHKPDEDYRIRVAEQRGEAGGYCSWSWHMAELRHSYYGYEAGICPRCHNVVPTVLSHAKYRSTGSILAQHQMLFIDHSSDRKL